MPRDPRFNFAEELRKAAGAIKPGPGGGPIVAGVSALDHIFEEEPVPLTVFVQDKRFLGNPPLSAVQYDAVRHIERIYYPDLYAKLGEEFESGKQPGRLHIASSSAAWREEKYWTESAKLRMINFASLQWGKGSGKDHVARISSMRVAYLLMCLISPQTYYGMPEQDTIHLLNVASNSAQAQQAFFNPIVRAVKKGWFANKCNPRQNLISFDKSVESISGHSDAESQEGLNLLLGIADEIDAFKSKKEMIVRKGAGAREPAKSAETILNMIRTSSATRFPEVFKNVRISYPRYLGSMIQRLTDEARKDFEERGRKSRHYVSGPMATWEVNPRVPGREAFAEDYREDPVMARAKYECRPTLAINPYFRNVQAVDSAFVFYDQEPLTVTYVLESTEGRRVWVPSYRFAEHFYPVRGAVYTMHADLAVSGDRAGIAMAHVMDYAEYEQTTEDEDGATHYVRESRPIVKVDFVVHYEADISMDPPREIQVRWARQLCFELIRRGFNIRLYTFDAFQCLSGDTKIPLLDGTSKTLRELEGAEPFWLYSIRDGRIVPGLCTRAWKTGYREDVLEVELDNGEKVRATSDHRFMLRDGTYIRADALTAGQSLMPLYRQTRRVSPTSAEYEQVWHPEADGSGKRWRFTHSMVSHYIYGAVPKGSLTHHVNCDERDNRPENLRQMTVADHSRLHRELSKGRFAELWADAEWREAHRLRISAAQTAAQTGKTGPASRRYRHDITFELIAKTHQEMLLAGERPTWALIGERLGIGQRALYARIQKAGFRSWKAYRDHVEGVSERNAYARERRKRRSADNHKVVAVRPAAPEDVYDLQVDEHHNFATEAGVFVHNSTDSMQILEAKGIETDKLSTDLSQEPWRNLRDLMYEGRIKIPRLRVENAREAPCLVRDEILALSKLPNGRIDHPADGSKDAADALACVAMSAVTLGGREDGQERRYYEPGTFTTGGAAELPFDVRSLKSVWVTELPELPAAF